MEKSSSDILVKSTLHYAEFYLTNHCNITCNNCNRFNNHKITGSADWEQYKQTYLKWSKILDINRIALLGGEPLLYPKIATTVADVRSWWPTAELEITTNGLLIQRIKPDLCNAIIDNNVSLYVSIHKKDWVDDIKSAIANKFGKLTLIKSSDFPHYDICKTELGVNVTLEYTYWFRSAALQANQDNKLVLHNSNPDAAHDVCDMKHSFHFWKGCLYKCGVMVTLPYVVEQKSLDCDISTDQLQLIKNYTPLTLDNVIDNPNIIHTLYDSIEQCKLCPENYNNYTEIFKT